MSVLDHLADLGPERVRPLKRVEFERLIEDGVFDEDERIELLGGVLVEMSPQGDEHTAAIIRLTKLLVRACGDRADVCVQVPYAASDDSLPEPDFAVVPPRDFRKARPQDALLLIEVAGTSLRKDRMLKGPLYARAGVPEYWIVNVTETCVEKHTEPRDGTYAVVTRFNLGDTLRIEALLDVEIVVADIFA